MTIPHAVTDNGPIDRNFRALDAAQARLAGFVLIGDGTPVATITAPVGAIYLRTDGGADTTLYVKESGGGTTAGWVAK